MVIFVKCEDIREKHLCELNLEGDVSGKIVGNDMTEVVSLFLLLFTDENPIVYIDTSPYGLAVSDQLRSLCGKINIVNCDSKYIGEIDSDSISKLSLKGFDKYKCNFKYMSNKESNTEYCG